MTTLNLDKFNASARSILERAQNLARKRRHRQIEPVHALVSLVMLTDGRVPKLLDELKVNVDDLLHRLNEELRLLPRSYDNNPQLTVSGELEDGIRDAERRMRDLGGSVVGPEHLLLALAGQSRGLAPRLLRQSGLTVDSITEKLRDSRTATAARVGEGKAADLGDLKLDNLTQYGRDMTAMAENGEFDPVIGREGEIRRAIQVLARRGKNNPVLIGPPGVGKTAIVELLCMRIAAGDVPESLKGRRIFSLELGSLVAGTSLRGQFEERIKGIVDEIINSRGRVIVYIDEIHNMVGAGGQEGAGNAANLLKPALARGELRCIGSTTPEEYKEYIEEDKALVRRFQAIQVEEPDTQQTIAILRGLKSRYESHHKVQIADGALVSAAKFATRYITDRHLPDKAVDLVDEACSSLRIQLDSKPSEVDSLERRIQNLEMERAALLDETNIEARESLQRIDRDLGTLREELSEIQGHWRIEKEVLDRVVELTEQSAAIEAEIEQARIKKDLARAAELQYGVRVELARELEEKNKSLASLHKGKTLLKTQVGPSDIADVVSAITGIPVNRMLEEEREKLLRMEDELGRRVIGQGPAIASISKAVRMSRAGVSDPNQPIGSFLFVGPTGVGKTELAKALAQFLFDTEEALIRIDMSEYQEQAKVNTLIGSARGYVGSEKGGVLTEAVRRRPYSVVLFDEAEKAHPKVFDILLQVLDEGRLSDSQGLEVDFTNTIILMTSNVGSREILDMSGNLSNEEMEDRIRELIKDYLKPEFINRIQDVAVFNALSLQDIRKIVDIQLKRLRRILAEQKLSIEVTEDAKAWLAKAGYEPEYGARPLKRAILNHVQDPLAVSILEGQFERGDTIYVGVTEDGTDLLFSSEPLPED
jgi:ATP-dependent Clp protease ATP-binding subunit ClpB